MREETKVRREQGRHKVCLNCKVEFCSITATGYRTPKMVSCSKECNAKFSVAKRRQKGTYSKNDHAIEKMHATKLAKDPEYGKKWAKTLQDRKERGLGGYDKEKYKHWSQVPENKEYLKSLLKGKKVEDNTRRLMSLARKKLIQNNPELIYSNANGGKREDLNNKYFRSNWEANYARILNEQSVFWEYEAHTFDLSDGTSYTPDFKLNEKKFVEIKGWWDDDSKHKIELFLKEYPDYELDLIGESEYYSLRNLFKHKIPTWEGK